MMIFRLLDAYEENMKDEDAFFERLKALNKKQRICLSILVMMTIILLVFTLGKNGKGLLIYMVCYLAVLVGMLIMIEKDRKQHHIENMKRYNERLEKLENMLLNEEYSIDSKGKMKSIIKQIDKYLKEVDVAENKAQEGNNQFLTVVIVPMVTFILGVYLQELDDVQVASYAMTLVIMIVPLRYGLKTAKEICREIFNPIPAKMRHFQKELEDLYMRKYV